MHLYFFIFFILLLFNCFKSSRVILFGHKWCRKTDKAQNIFNKLMSQPKFSHAQFKIVQNSCKQQNNSSFIKSQQILKELRLNNLNQNMRIPYPSIYFSCQNFKGFYQNQLTFTQLSYWIQIYCSQLAQLPTCSLSHSQQYKFQFPQSFWKDITTNNKQAQVQFLITNPQIKICATKSNKAKTKNQAQNQTQVKSIEHIKFQNSKISYNQLKKIPFQPLFFKKFNHNVRNHMILQDKIAVMIIYTELNNYKINQFQQIYKSAMTEKSLMGQQLRKVRDQYPLVYQIQEQNKQRLLFISTCYNPQQPSKCISKSTNNKTARNQYSKHKTIKSLLDFINLKHYFQLSQGKQLIFAFRFNKDTDSIQKYIYDSTSHNLGNQFLFWINWIFKRTQNKKQHQLIHTKDFCTKNQIVHKYDPRDLESINLNLKLIKNYQKQQKQIQISSIESVQHSIHIFKVCKKNKQPLYTNSYQQVISYNFFQEQLQNNLPIIEQL